MKLKFFIFVFFSIIVGVLIGVSVYNQYDNDKIVLSNNDEIYFLQQGVYKELNNLNNNTKNINNFIYLKKENLYIVYLAITATEESALKLKSFYNERNIDVYIKKGNIKNMSFIQKLKTYDKQIKENQEENKIFDIVFKILNEYKVVMENEK